MIDSLLFGRQDIEKEQIESLCPQLSMDRTYYRDLTWSIGNLQQLLLKKV